MMIGTGKRIERIYMFTLILLAMSLSLDAFAVALAQSMNSTKIPLLSKLIICLLSITYFGAAVWLGEILSVFLSPMAEKILGIVLMLAICLWMMIQYLCQRHAKKMLEQDIVKEKTLFCISLHEVGLSFQVIFNPMNSDTDGSKSISPKEALFMGTALSIDSINIGMGYALLGSVHLFAPLLVGLFQFAFLSLGDFIGTRLKTHKFKDSDRLQLVSIVVMFILTIIRTLP